MQKNLLTALFLTLFALNFVQAQKLGHYKKQIDDYCWESDDPKKSITEVPVKWKDKSAVILYYDSQIYGTKESGSYVKIRAFDHFRIKIQDEAALNDFSELYFNNHGKTYLRYTEVDYDRGVKVIKPGGEEEIVDLKNIVDAEGGNKRKKLAIPNLEVGDILDYYTYSAQTGPAYSNPHYAVVEKNTLVSEFPVLYTTVKVEVDQNWELQYRAVNGGPELGMKTEGEKKDKRWIFSFNAKDIDNYKDHEWSYHFQSYPYYKLYLRYKQDFIKDRLDEGEKPYLASLSNDKIKNYYDGYYKADPQARNEYSKFKSYLKKNGMSEISNKEKLEAYYYFLRHLFKNKHLIHDEYNNESDRPALSPYSFTGHLIYAIRDMEMDYQVLVITPRHAGQIDDLLNLDETFYLLRVKSGGEDLYLYQPDRHTMFDQIPSTIEGSEVYTLDSPDEKVRNLTFKKERVPVTSHGDNATIFHTQVSFAENLTDAATVTGQVTAKGLANIYFKDRMLNVFDFVLEENDHYNTKRWGDIENEKGSFKDKLVRMREDHLKDREEYWDSYITDDFQGDVEISELKIEKTGNFIKNRDFQFSYKATVEDLVKKAGPNYILNAGHLVGSQVDVKEEDKTRDVDVHMRYARAFEYLVTVDIPEGYTVEGLENFNKNVENETGILRSTGKVSEGKIVLTLFKAYKNNYEKAENWPKMVEFLDAAYQFTQEKLLLKDPQK